MIHTCTVHRIQHFMCLRPASCLWYYYFYTALLFWGNRIIRIYYSWRYRTEYKLWFSFFPQTSKHHPFKDGSPEKDKQQSDRNNGRRSGAFLPGECQADEYVQTVLWLPSFRESEWSKTMLTWHEVHSLTGWEDTGENLFWNGAFYFHKIRCFFLFCYWACIQIITGIKGPMWT